MVWETKLQAAVLQVGNRREAWNRVKLVIVNVAGVEDANDGVGGKITSDIYSVREKLSVSRTGASMCRLVAGATGRPTCRVESITTAPVW